MSPAKEELPLENNNTFVYVDDYEETEKQKEEAERLEKEFEERERQRQKEAEEAEKHRLAELKKKKEEEHKKRLENERMRQLQAIYEEKERAKQQRLKEIEAEKERERLKREAEEKAEKERLQKLKEAAEEMERLKAIEAEKERQLQLKQEESLLAKMQQENEEKSEEVDGMISGNEEDEVNDEFFEEEEEEKEPELTMEELQKLALPKAVGKVLGNPTKYKKRDENAKKEMNRDLRKLSVIFKDDDIDSDNKNFTKVAVLKYYDVLFPTFRKYCKIGGDSDWLTIEGWDALMKDAFIIDEQNGPTAKECHDLFYSIYNQHHDLNAAHKKKLSLRQSELMKKQHLKVSTRTFVLSEWNDDDPWTGG